MGPMLVLRDPGAPTLGGSHIWLAGIDFWSFCWLGFGPCFGISLFFGRPANAHPPPSLRCLEGSGGSENSSPCCSFSYSFPYSPLEPFGPLPLSLLPQWFWGWVGCVPSLPCGSCPENFLLPPVSPFLLPSSVWKEPLTSWPDVKLPPQTISLPLALGVRVPPWVFPLGAKGLKGGFVGSPKDHLGGGEIKQGVLIVFMKRWTGHETR